MALRDRSSTLNGSRGPAPTAGSFSPLGSSASSTRSLRMRRSFFGRSNSDAGLLRRIANQPATQSISEAQKEQLPPRPSTSLSIESMRRRKTDPLETIRNSIFGGRKSKEREDSNASGGARPSSRNGESSDAMLSNSREHFRSEDDCKLRYNRIDFLH